MDEAFAQRLSNPISTDAPAGVSNRYEPEYEQLQAEIVSEQAVNKSLPGMSFIDCLTLFEQDPDTQSIFMVGEIGGTAEEEAAEFIQTNVSKPVTAFIAGGMGTAEEKFQALEKAGVNIVRSPADLGKGVAEATSPHFSPGHCITRVIA